ncbi:winged helix-turn-helix transcriptional regulator [Streptacidiphilus fuscans]|uniref:Helix-turn-helix transcriptional regulator n=1 Tax=Streptacidiphilus fuscans TaxID=2789292 RepID=A0A931BAN8_9ACTN|nr:winged helix-turn-helix transcriptional regulator [Streptacidiphilus fuscans]MBF9071757.1 helix-turn-helix transcriptional regulator [Streptacidiphilus fuscans]
MTPAVLTTAADLSGVEDTLRALAPRWTMWITSTLLYSGRPMQRHELEDALPFIPTSSLDLRLGQLRDRGLIERSRASQRAPMRLTDEGEALGSLYTAVCVWAGVHQDTATPMANTERVEQALHRLALTGTTTMVQLLTQHGDTHLTELAKALDQSEQLTLLRLRRMQDDGLVERAGPQYRAPYTLTAAARDLPPVYTAAHQWAHRHTQQAAPVQRAAARTSRLLAASRAGGAVPSVRFSDLASAPAASYAAGVGRGAARR